MPFQMAEKNSYWFPISPRFQWLAGMLGVLYLIGYLFGIASYYFTLLGEHSMPPLSLLVWGGFFLLVSCLKPKLRTYTKTDVFARKLFGWTIFMGILGLGIWIAVSLTLPYWS